MGLSELGEAVDERERRQALRTLDRMSISFCLITQPSEECLSARVRVSVAHSPLQSRHTALSDPVAPLRMRGLSGTLVLVSSFASEPVWSQWV